LTATHDQQTSGLTTVFYAEFPPSPDLAHVLRCIWVFEATGDAANETSAPQRIVPDGHPEFIIHYGDRFREAGATREQPRVLFAGQIAQPLWLESGASAGVIGVRFHAAAARPLLGVAMHELTDTRHDLSLLWGSEAGRLWEEIAELQGTERRVRRAEGLVRRRLAQSKARRDELVTQCVAALDARDATRVETLVRQSSISARQLERRFRQEVGLPPRLLSSILRFRRIFDVLEHEQPARWVQAALAAGYFDQAHMIRDFRRFAGCTPREYLQSSPGLASALAAAR
jgi:AraC-like DNA-binding protein